MTRNTAERAVYGFAVAAVTSAAVGAVLAPGDLEITFFMVCAVIAGLACFDTSMDRHAQSFTPWLLLSLAPAAKTVPTVWYVLNSERGLSEERWEHAGSLAFGACVLAATWLLSRPSKDLGRTTAGLDSLVLFGAAATAGMAGSSVAFLFDSDFGSETAQRVLEGLSWAVVGGLLATTALAAGRARELTAPLVGVLATAAATAGLLAYTVAGSALDRGWWAVLFAFLTWSAGAFGLAMLGMRESRTRKSHAAPWVAGLAGAVAAAAAISARGDRTAWSTGWILLGVMSLGLFALALLWPTSEEHDQVDGEIDINEAIAQARAKESALGRLRQASAASSGASIEPPAREMAATARTSAVAEPRVAVPPPVSEPRVAVPPPVSEPRVAVPSALVEPSAPVIPVAEPPVAVPSALVEPSAPVAEPPVSEPPVSEPPVAVPSAPLVPVAEPPVAVPSAPLVPVAEPPVPVPPVAVPPVAVPPVAVPPVAVPPVAVPPARVVVEPVPAAARFDRPAETPAPLAEPASAWPFEAYIAAVPGESPAPATTPTRRPASPPPRPRPEPQPNPFYVPAAHHLDPSTGLLSGAGLQEMIVRGFDSAPSAGSLTVMMLTIRDLDEIEATHGRLSAAAVTREVAHRLQTLLPDGTSARFARAAYAVVFVDIDEAPNQTVQRLARSLKRMRLPVADSGSSSEIDVVAGMAQCYEGEDAASFIRRGNYGLAKAVKSPEPSFVAMP